MIRLQIALAVLVLVSCQRASNSSQAGQSAQKEASHMSATATLDQLLESGNWDAVEEAQRQGALALPTIRTFAQGKNPVARQIAMACAARVGGNDAAAILAAGLTDSDVNVQLTAAKELTGGKFPAASGAILDQLAKGKDDLVREFLALDAGYIPGEKTLAILRPLADAEGGLGENARMALARLGDPRARAVLARNLSSLTPATRYESLDQLRYVGDMDLIPAAKKLVDDAEPARRIGPARRPRFRRVCDQAVDTLTFLLKLTPPFPVAAEKIYSKAELTEFKQLLR